LYSKIDSTTSSNAMTIREYKGFYRKCNSLPKLTHISRFSIWISTMVTIKNYSYCNACWVLP